MMNTYECKQCGMAVKATCGNCDVPLENGMIDLCFNDFKSNTTSLFLQNENQEFIHDNLYDYQNSHVTNLSVLDFDSDKDLDIILCNVFDGTIVLLENQRYDVINYIEIAYRVYKYISNNLYF